jgi:hypothetical protein
VQDDRGFIVGQGADGRVDLFGRLHRHAGCVPVRYGLPGRQLGSVDRLRASEGRPCPRSPPCLQRGKGAAIRRGQVGQRDRNRPALTERVGQVGVVQAVDERAAFRAKRRCAGRARDRSSCSPDLQVGSVALSGEPAASHDVS